MGNSYKSQGDIDGEIWKKVEGFELFYEISNKGRAKSFKKGRWGIGEGKYLSLSSSKKGYSVMYMNGKTYNVHRLVALHFIPNPENLPCACHIKEDLDEKGRLYNGEDNLYWGTYSENMFDKYKKGRANNPYQLNHPNTGKFGEENQMSKKVNQYTKDGIFIRQWGSTMDIERELFIGNSDISKCCRGIRSKTAGGFIWKYS